MLNKNADKFEFITAAEARQISEPVSRLLDNGLTIPLIHNLIITTASLGFGRIVVTIKPNSLPALTEAFPNFRYHVLTDYKEPLYPECIVVMIIW